VGSVDPTDSPDVGRVVAKAVLERWYDGGRMLVAVGGEFMAYRNGVWIHTEDRVIERQVLELLPAIPQAMKVKHATIKKEVVDLLRTLQSRDDDPFCRLSEPPRVINCLNVEVWLHDDGRVEVRPHSPESYLEHQLPIDYDPEAVCPRYDQALMDIFAKATNPKAMARHWNELVGYIIQPRRQHALIIILLGGGSNGKTKLVATIMRLLSQGLVYSARIEDLDKDRFALGHLRGKRLFVDDDVQAGAKLPDGMLKKISEEKELTGDKKFRAKFNFTARIVPVMICNNIPSLADLSHGMMRRLQVLPMERRFGPKSSNPTLFEEIWGKELPGVLNRAIEGWQRLQRRQHFKLPVDVKRAIGKWRQYANPLAGFIHDRCVKDPNKRVLLREFYAAYGAWADSSGITRTQQLPVVRRNLEHMGFTIKHGNKGTIVVGLTLKQGLGSD